MVTSLFIILFTVFSTFVVLAAGNEFMTRMKNRADRNRLSQEPLQQPVFETGSR
ncbi:MULTISPECIES: hypothetical protein [Salimicrobium]|uniref:Uncharacterized protein n=1 Tax=Salimicrobium album TaxID=50717 RepID=A0A1H3F3R2_9BACI|nr:MULTISPECIES: hypothetical protein [Salimicrobium]MBM7696028.1 hypothetical protein [Salimicrobium jeotgali]SDX85555.1 hypothetical protein SAMN04488081_1499 [Salimicrobium album]